MNTFRTFLSWVCIEAIFNCVVDLLHCVVPARCFPRKCGWRSFGEKNCMSGKYIVTQVGRKRKLRDKKLNNVNSEGSVVFNHWLHVVNLIVSHVKWKSHLYSFTHFAGIILSITGMQKIQALFRDNTVEPRFNEPLYKEVLGITNDILQPDRSYSKMYGTEPRYNEIPVIPNTIQKPKRTIYPDITNKCQHLAKDKYEGQTRMKIL